MLVVVREDIDAFETGNAKRLVVALEGVLGIDIILAFADEKADGRVVTLAFQKVIGTGDIAA